MKHFSILIVICLLGAMLLSSCAPKIYGARPHRRDKNCGCQLIQPTAISTQTMTL